jgi:hypothetical protein
VRGSPDRACHLAKHAFDEAVAAMHATPEATFRDSLMILHLLRDDIILWSAEMQPDGMRAIRFSRFGCCSYENFSLCLS